MPQLVFYRRGLLLMRVRLDRSPTTVGSDHAATVVLPEPGVAPLQAEFVGEDSVWTLIDRSGRGTMARGRLKHELQLLDGDRIALGECEVVYRTLPEGARADPSGARTEAGEEQEPQLPDELWLHARLLGDPDSLRSVRLGESIDIGSALGAGLRLGSPMISANHARLSRIAGRLVLQDLRSRNGTWYQSGLAFELGLPVGAHFKVTPWDLWVTTEPPGAKPKAEELEGMVSGDPVLLALFRDFDRMAAFPGSVVIHAETGAGKELVAKALHQRSPRVSRPFVAINCALLEPTRVESELFGHAQGAYTGATAAHRGAFQRADGGTLFLDEVAELDLAVQAKLLRALEEREVQPMGSETLFRVDVRVVCASHRLLQDEVRAGRFRRDLYFRLCGATVELPPLRDRKGDVLVLWDHFVRLLDPPAVPTLSPAAREKLERHPWPGNVRELRRVVQCAIYFAEGRPVIGPDELRLDEAEPAPELGDLVDSRGKTLEQIEAAAIAAVMRRLGGNRTGAACELDIDKKTLLKKLERYGLVSLGLPADAEHPRDYNRNT
ncbi:MAG: sigma 54-interacting transcriptional regulator [Deltaproteobacteria bacterium]